MIFFVQQFVPSCFLGPPEVWVVVLHPPAPFVLLFAALQRILPKVFGAPRTVAGFPGLKVLVTLNASARNSTRFPSPIWNSRETASSHSQNPGPTMLLWLP